MTLEDIIKPYLDMPQSKSLLGRIERDLKRHYPGDYSVTFKGDAVVINSKDESVLTWLALLQ